MCRLLGMFFGFVMLAFIFSCIPEIIPQESKLDTPSWHYDNGVKLFQAGKLEAAKSEFNRSLEIDQEYAPAFVGLGLVSTARGQHGDALRKMELARLFTRNRFENVMVHVGFMRTYLEGGEKIDSGWLGKTEDHYKKSILLTHEKSEPYYFMGLAYKKAQKMEKALEQFMYVVNMQDKYVAEALEQISEIQSTQGKTF